MNGKEPDYIGLIVSARDAFRVSRGAALFK